MRPQVHTYSVELPSHRLKERYRIAPDGTCVDAGKDLPTELSADPNKVCPI